ncbi:hypothetical protein Z517_05896 [Fonsecaea pedrosoi CBS 271.37]|uniref:Unplaced genomic scaffold supercont1.4, whole genome shotgun sequence n=1 Tax=Fonsecaea pedrosoi CBS 271.37 TaxID=1442368 RepID=A0A0D2H3P9_9EURO|nr:uncharacterized protein Z517_05896 [Fonsecaea pedrosoi CBS 271.37]KIW79284.1 hypothetical protein Z517_05896 [Fonsecaea pedrosoi CBS 271.37]
MPFDLSLSPLGPEPMFDVYFQGLAQGADQYRIFTPGWLGAEETHRLNQTPISMAPPIGNGTVVEGSLGSDDVHGRRSFAAASEPAESVHTLASYDKPDLFSIDIPPAIAEHLLDLYFQKIQPALPLLHRPRFLASLPGAGQVEHQLYQNLDLESALLLNGIFALAARFSEKTDFWTCEPKMRGEPFAKKAQVLCDLGSRDEDEDHLTMKYLHGCILLTYYQLSSRPSFRAWVGVGLCCRLAYALCVHQVDRDSESSPPDAQISVEDWCDKEERRRAWWVIFQMDNFASVIGARPFSLDMKRSDVWLPVSDEAWFDLRPVGSAPISSKGPAAAWRSLLDTENKDAYAWYLVGNFLLRSAQEEFEKRDRSLGNLKILQSAIHCFCLSLPPNLRMKSKNLDFAENSFRDKNWIIAMHFIIHSNNIIVNLGLYAEGLKNQGSIMSDVSPLQDESTSLEMSAGSPAQQCGKVLRDQISVVRMWTPDFIALASPFITAAIVGPAAAHSADRSLLESDVRDEALAALDGNLLDLVLRRFSEYWGIGQFCLGECWHWHGRSCF